MQLIKIFWAFLTFLPFFGAVLAANDCPLMWTDATHAGLGCLFFETSQNMTWEEAQVFCTTLHLGSYLVEIKNEKHQDYLEMKMYEIDEITESKRDWWIGLTDKDSEGHWLWFHSGKEATYTHWVEGEPKPGKLLTYAYMSRGMTHKGQWHVTTAENSKFPICQYTNWST